MTDQLTRVRQNYRAAFLRYLSRGDELALWSAYELGRECLSGGVSLLDVVQIHHRVLVDALRDTDANELEYIADAAATFLAEVLASFEMTRRGFFESGSRSAPDSPRPDPAT